MRIIRKIFSFVIVLSFMLSISVGAFADVALNDSGTPVDNSGEGWTYSENTLNITSGSHAVTGAEGVSYSGSLNISSGATLTGGSFKGTVTNDGIISGGTFNYGSSVTNDGRISGGTFTGNVENSGTIDGGTFNRLSNVENSGSITDGDFKGTVTNDGSISGGTFTEGGETGKLKNTGSISGGSFDYNVFNESSGSISGGSFSARVTNYSSITGGSFDGSVRNDTYSLQEGEFVYTGIIDGGTFNGTVTNNTEIKSGTFNGEVDNYGSISGGSFSYYVYNDVSGTIENGNFSQHIYNGGTIEDGSFSDSVVNSGTIKNGSFSDQVTSVGTIGGGSFTGAVTNKENGSIDGGTFKTAPLDENGAPIESDKITIDPNLGESPVQPSPGAAASASSGICGVPTGSDGGAVSVVLMGSAGIVWDDALSAYLAEHDGGNISIDCRGLNISALSFSEAGIGMLIEAIGTGTLEIIFDNGTVTYTASDLSSLSPSPENPRILLSC